MCSMEALYRYVTHGKAAGEFAPAVEEDGVVGLTLGHAVPVVILVLDALDKVRLHDSHVLELRRLHVF